MENRYDAGSVIVLTGVGGRIGQILWRELAADCRLAGIDLAPTTDPRVYRADVANYEQLWLAFAQLGEIAAIVHLAADPRVEADWQSVLLNNIHGTRNVYEIARLRGVPRVVFASSNHVTGAYEGFPPSRHLDPPAQPLDADGPIRPDSYYGVGKACGEALARMYYELYGIASICLRIGSVLADDDPTRDVRHGSTWLSHRDLVQLVRRSLVADQSFGIYYGVSRNRQRIWDISSAERELGYAPQDDAATR